jgi:UDP-glucose 4-epimerase
VLVTGAAGFIGSHLCDLLVENGNEVVGVDNYSKGRIDNLDKCLNAKLFNFFEGDVADKDFLIEHSKNCDAVYHLADESDIQHALEHPESYFHGNISGLFSVLSAMKINGVKKLFFPSSTTVFGSNASPPIAENYGPLLPESLYGASKVSAEAFLKAWSHAYSFDVLIFRFAAIIGGRQDHGVVHDFIKRLTINPHRLDVLGNGSQLRSFVLVDDCVEILSNYFIDKERSGYEVVHLANPDTISIKCVAEIACAEMGLDSEIIRFEDQDLGWVGDSKTNQLDISTLISKGILPKRNSEQAVIESARRLKIQYEKFKLKND